jgi:hypothetical protein
VEVVMVTRGDVLKRYFSVSRRPVTNEELIDCRKNDPLGYEELAEAALAALSGDASRVAEDLRRPWLQWVVNQIG